MINKDYYKSLFILIIFLIIFEGIVAYFGINRSYWGDEAHFIPTINRFGDDLSITTIKHYNEMSTPLPFILYSFWGRIFNFDVQTLRIFSLIIAFITYLLFYKLTSSIFNDNKLSLLTTAFIVLHPYMVGFSIFVFTDMLAILFIVLSCISIRNQNPIILSISLASGLLCRQYFIFFVLAVGAYYVFIFWINKNSTIAYKMLVSCLTSIIPMMILIVLWHGLSPDNELRKSILTEGYSYHLSYFTAYVCQLFIYLFPVVLISWKAIYKNTKVIISCLALSLFYWLFPVRTPQILIDSNIHTFGFFHKFIRNIFDNMLIEDMIFYSTFILGLPILIFVVKDIFYKLQEQSADFSLLLDLAIITFLLIMPISYLVWEKYFLLLLPLATVRILLIKYPETSG